MPLGRSRKPGWTEIKWDTSDADVNLLGDNIDTIQEVGPDVNSEKTNYMFAVS
jgi:hypothetical protein